MTRQPMSDGPSADVRRAPLEAQIDLLTDELDRLHEIAWTGWEAAEFERLFTARRRLVEEWEKTR